MRSKAREDGVHLPKRLWHQRGHRVDETIESQALKQADRGECQTGSSGIGGDMKQHLPLHPRESRGQAGLLVQEFEALDEFVILHAGGAGGFAGEALEAEIEVAVDFLVEVDFAV